MIFDNLEKDKKRLQDYYASSWDFIEKAKDINNKFREVNWINAQSTIKDAELLAIHYPELKESYQQESSKIFYALKSIEKLIF